MLRWMWECLANPVELSLKQRLWSCALFVHSSVHCQRVLLEQLDHGYLLFAELYFLLLKPAIKLKLERRSGGEEKNPARIREQGRDSAWRAITGTLTLLAAPISPRAHLGQT